MRQHTNRSKNPKLKSDPSVESVTSPYFSVSSSSRRSTRKCVLDKLHPSEAENKENTSPVMLEDGPTRSDSDEVGSDGCSPTSSGECVPIVRRSSTVGKRRTKIRQINTPRPKRRKAQRPAHVVPDPTLSGSVSSISEGIDFSEDEWKPTQETGETPSSDEFLSVTSTLPSNESSPKKPKPLIGKSRGNKPVFSKKRIKKRNFIAHDDSDVDESVEDWEEVVDDQHMMQEKDFVQLLLKRKLENVPTLTDKPELNLRVQLDGSTSNPTDPKVLEARARQRQLAQMSFSMHYVHVLCFLTHARVLNHVCDRPFYRALGLSVLDRADLIRDEGQSFIASDLWTIDHIQSCIISILSRRLVEKSNPTVATLVQRLSTSNLSTGDCTLLLVSALRQLEFDVRLVVALCPLPLKPTVQHGKQRKQTPPKIAVKRIKKEPNRQIISSDDEVEEEIDYSSSDSTHSGQVSIFAEVYLPTAKRWICIDLTSPTGCVDKPHSDSRFLYVLGVTSTNVSSEHLKPYVGRNPVDLGARYDQNWCIHSRALRLPPDKWNHLLDLMRIYFNRDAVNGMCLTSRSPDSPTFLRDKEDEHYIRSVLLKHPMPESVGDFKSHPLYALERHLLKFEVLHPPDALPLGFVRGEAVYSRDCVHLCHTRESWLKEAKVVRIGEKPAKVVKARMSMKRKLLTQSSSASTPPTVDVFGAWQVEDYQPPVAKDGVVPRNEHGTIDLFQPSMLPIGCAHICLTGIHLIAKRLNIDYAPAVIGWTFHGAGWAHPKVHGYVVCKEAVPTLLDAWRSVQMTADRMKAEERLARVLDNWRRLVRGLFIWHRVKAQFALAALHDPPNIKPAKKSTANRPRAQKPKGTVTAANEAESADLSSSVVQTVEIGSVTAGLTSEGWQRLGAPTSVTNPLPHLAAKKVPNPSAKQCKYSRRGRGGRRRSSRKRASPQSSEEDEESEREFQSDTSN